MKKMLLLFLIFSGCTKSVKKISITGIWNYEIGKPILNTKGVDIPQYQIFSFIPYFFEAFEIEKISEVNYRIWPLTKDSNNGKYIRDQYSSSASYDNKTGVLIINNDSWSKEYAPIVLELNPTNKSNNSYFEGKFTLYSGWGDVLQGTSYGPDSIRGNWTWKRQN